MSLISDKIMWVATWHFFVCSSPYWNGMCKLIVLGDPCGRKPEWGSWTPLTHASQASNEKISGEWRQERMLRGCRTLQELTSIHFTRCIAAFSTEYITTDLRDDSGPVCRGSNNFSKDTICFDVLFSFGFLCVCFGLCFSTTLHTALYCNSKFTVPIKSVSPRWRT